VKFFVDANIYLGFYDRSNREFKKLLNSLLELKKHIFITGQIVNEVQRNKLNVAARSFKENSKNLGIRKAMLPEHLEDIKNPKMKTWNRKRNKLKAAEDSLKRDYDKIVQESLKSVMCSTDNVSLILEKLFVYPIVANEQEIAAARKRKELGNPPGKLSDPLGDGISWEQLLNMYDGSQEIWIVTNDRDFFAEYDGKLYLNSFLYSELVSRGNNKPPSIFCFKSLADGLAKFNEISGHKIKGLPPPDLLDAIRMEEAAMLQRFPVESSNIASIGYDPATFVLEVEFHSGGIYQYSGVPEDVYHSLMDAGAKGSYFHQNIKSAGYPYTKGGVQKERKVFLEGLNDRQKKAINYIRQHSYITRKDYQEINETGKAMAVRDLNQLIDRKIIQKLGKGKTTRYIVNE